MADTLFDLHHRMTYAAAKANGKTHYYTGRACKRGHNSLRFVSTRQCVDCQRFHDRSINGAKHYIDRGRADYLADKKKRPWKYILRNARTRALKHGLAFDLTDDWIKSRWTGKCELSGIKFDVSYGKQGGRPFSPSIDKKIPSLGYTQDNCWVILLAYNMAKGNGSLNDLSRILSAVSTTETAGNTQWL